MVEEGPPSVVEEGSLGACLETTLETPHCVMATWTCDSCGATGVVPEGSTSDQVLCDTCGEPVLPDE